MRKLSICLLTAATTLAAAGAVPATAYAATGTYNIPGGKVVVIGGTMNGANCDQILPGINLPGIQFPGVNMPGSNVPDNSLPMPEFPIPDYPGNMLPDQPGDLTPDQPEADGSQDAFANQVVKLVNEERAKAGLSPLTVHNGAASAAQTRAREIERSFSHTRPDGSSFNTALTAAGVNFRGAGENIAYGQSTPQQVMEGWMNSSGHRANILNANYTSIGVGHYKNASGVDYWTQLFIQ
ncbi:CAP domain-containing protein [Clostridium sp. FS41]|uniref:CAP domain-containing protein n=1 Tax=Clostridia TaxID=186801 RepID=UPI0005D36779|nr:CAP domain-containing protein [Clostridium sp. FS41]KJJ67825.1 cysteine-rich secretory protein family protein [Clostridium sp. FS41]